MRQLSWTDAAFVRLETATAPLHINAVMIYDQSTAAGGRVTFKGILAAIEGRLHLAPSLRQKLVDPPLSVSAPYWVDDPDFDLEFHVRHIALPKPGDWRQLCIQISRLHARPLDLSRPPWEMTVIEGLDAVEGLPKGCFALSLKVHHSAVDGAEGVELISIMHDLTADAAPVPPPEDDWKPRPQPSQLELLRRATTAGLQNPSRIAHVTAAHAPSALRAALPRAMSLLRRETTAIPRTRFNAAITPHRVCDCLTIDFQVVRTIKAAVPGATVNDVALAVAGGALRRYLLAHDELPEDSLIAGCPISTRSPTERGTGGNLLSAMRQSLHTDEASPIGRLSAIHADTSKDRATRKAVKAPALLEVAQLLPGALLGIGGRALASMPRGGPAIVNVALTNVPGSPVPLYFAGAKLTRFMGNGPLFPGMALMLLVGSYAGEFIFSFTSDRSVMPDPAFFTECIQASFDELLAAA